MKIAAILLAAGSSRRFGGENKLLANIEGVPMVARSADALLRVTPSLRPITVVTGYQQDSVRDSLGEILGRENHMTFAYNPDYASGIASSVHTGLRALPDGVDGAVIALADMPWVKSSHIEKLVEAFEGRESICVPVAGGRRGNPTLWGASYFKRMFSCKDDVGARDLLLEFTDCVREVVFDDTATLTDVDTPDAWKSDKT
ncbi:MAG: nucleotidyltransferase family protein [Hyphomicrobiales bacterium]|nr:nucleotidyltransferase family protein [Hyphomicrobiales bacterium]